MAGIEIGEVWLDGLWGLHMRDIEIDVFGEFDSLQNHTILRKNDFI